MVTLLLSLIAGAYGCIRYLKAPKPSAYAKRVFLAYVVNVFVIAGLLEFGGRPWLLMMLPSLYALLFLAWELHEALSHPELDKKHLIFPNFIPTLVAFAAFCGFMSLQAIK